MFSKFTVPAIFAETLLEDLGGCEPFDVFVERIDVEIAVDLADGAVAIPHWDTLYLREKKGDFYGSAVARCFVFLEVLSVVLVWVEEGLALWDGGGECWRL